jgi:hypothetical protein
MADNNSTLSTALDNPDQIIEKIKISNGDTSPTSTATVDSGEPTKAGKEIMMSAGSTSPASTAAAVSEESSQAGDDVAMVNSDTSSRTTPDVALQSRDEADVSVDNTLVKPLAEVDSTPTDTPDTLVRETAEVPIDLKPRPMFTMSTKGRSSRGPGQFPVNKGGKEARPAAKSEREERKRAREDDSSSDADDENESDNRRKKRVKPEVMRTIELADDTDDTSTSIHKPAQSARG